MWHVLVASNTLAIKQESTGEVAHLQLAACFPAFAIVGLTARFVMLPVFDLHCDLLAYLANIDGADPMSNEIGCSIPALKAGNVQMQTLAIFTTTGVGSAALGVQQAFVFEELVAAAEDRHFVPLEHPAMIEDMPCSNESVERIIGIAAIENASGFCEEDEALEEGLERLEFMLEIVSPLLYISLTHNDENRFGGGNYSGSENGRDGGVGLKDDGRALLEFLSGRRIAVDLSHASDALARDVLDYTYSHGLDIPILASHSNTRAVYSHVRNLPDDVAQEIIARDGLIGITLCAEFIHEYNSNVLMEHIAYVCDVLGGANALALGSDFFYTPDESEFFYDYRDAAQFSFMFAQAASWLDEDQLRNFAYGNVQRFLQQLWS